MNRFIRSVCVVLILLVGGLALISSGCSNSNPQGFAIYLTRDDVSPSQMETLSHIDIADQPIVGIDDIITYNGQTFEIQLTDSAYQRIFNLDVPVSGKSFVVTLNKQTIYWGAFWTPVSSLSFDGVTIWKPFSSSESRVITLELGYPSTSYLGGQDPRNNPEILKSLKQSGKLIDKLSIDTIETLPQSMKGYELYSWMADNQWHFTLITGTNRNKTVEEITSPDNFISETGWMKIQVIGIDSIKIVLSKVPKGEYVTWLGGNFTASQTGVNFSLPPASMVNEIKTSAAQFGWILQVASP